MDCSSTGPILNPRVRKAKNQKPLHSTAMVQYYAGVWYPSLAVPLPERFGNHIWSSGQSCSIPKPSTATTAYPPTWLALFGSSPGFVWVFTRRTCHTIPQTDQPEGGLTTRPLSPRCRSPSQKTGWDWAMLQCLLHFLARCVQRCSILHISRVYIRATYCTLSTLRTWTLGACCTSITEYYIGRRCSSVLKRNALKRVQYP